MLAHAKKELMYMSTNINDKAVQALLNTKAKHNFVTEDEAKHLSLKTTKKGAILKAESLISPSCL